MIGGPFDKDGMIGSQFNAANGGMAGCVERMVDGPSQARNPKTHTGLMNKHKAAECIRGEVGRGIVVGRRNLRNFGEMEDIGGVRTMHMR